MSEELISFKRPFQMWVFTVGHKQLLLRSPKEEGSTTRIDVLFKNVAVIDLPTFLDGLTISEATQREQMAIEERIGASKVDQRRTFIVRTVNFDGFVIAGAVAWHEDEREYDDPSHFSLTPKLNTP